MFFSLFFQHFTFGVLQADFIMAVIKIVFMLWTNGEHQISSGLIDKYKVSTSRNASRFLGYLRLKGVWTKHSASYKSSTVSMSNNQNSTIVYVVGCHKLHSLTEILTHTHSHIWKLVKKLIVVFSHLFLAELIILLMINVNLFIIYYINRCVLLNNQSFSPTWAFILFSHAY